ncbi:uncharacterized protein PGRI_015030 [Penicillium griseofulvum]|uniref:Protein kinase domain-containing protein n=1 Tax=Penicillium patulum TaxID=5078 RepID=A0A135LF91_PENPA|nr:uncharacterized protein PGRI_015030 [Penicillium griseofulvum]KXG47633.1 hypothetical protein PGRI_015030 [Penicillium griseofulvum]
MDGLDESLKLDVESVNEHYFRETEVQEDRREIVFWDRKISLTCSPANNVFLYESQQKDLRVFKHIRNTINYRELSVMERVMKEVKYVYLKTPQGQDKGLSVLHKLGITHRDIKPENVLVVAQNPIRVKIADFGISKLSQKGITQPRTQAGTDGYMAPECFGINNRTKESSYTHAVDIWSLGCLVYYILTKELPFKRRKDEFTSYIMIQRYCDGALSFPEEALTRQRISLSGRYFIQRLLAPVAENRPKASGQLMLDWVIPVSHITSQDSETTDSSEFGSSTIDSDTEIAPQTQLLYSQHELFDFPPLPLPSPLYAQESVQGINKSDMDLHSSDLWHLVKSEKGNKSNIKKLRSLLRANASANIHLKGYTALHIAAEQGPAESIETLLEFKADPRIRTEPRQETAIHLATCQGEFDTFSKKLRLLLRKGADIDAENFEGDTSLHLAICRIGTVDAVKILLKSGASTEVKGRHGRTPLQYAVFLGREEIATALLRYKANPNCFDNDGFTPLHLAIRSNRISIEFLKMLIEAGVNINQEDGNHHTPLYEAVTQGRHDAVRLLLDHDAKCKPHHPELERRFGQAGFWQNFVRLPWGSQ